MQPASALPEKAGESVSISSRVRAMMQSPFAEDIRRRSEEFLAFRTAGKEKVFGEFCFCLLTANTSAEMGVRTQELIGIDGFMNYSERELRDALKDSRYRFYNLRSRFIVESRWIMDELPSLINASDSFGTREYLVENIKGMGYKESSHFLRNVGVFDFAILDKHILRMLHQEYPELTPKATSRKLYLSGEDMVLSIARDLGLEPGILDLYMWKIATGKLIK